MTGVRVHISDDPANIGKTVNAVVLTSTGAPKGTSAPVVLTSSDLGTYKLFPIIPDTPIYYFYLVAPFYVGLRQTASTTAYSPVSYQNEGIPTRPDAYFTKTVTARNFIPQTNVGRFMIDALINNATIPVTLTNFYATRRGGVNKLSWSTSEEINSKEFYC